MMVPVGCIFKLRILLGLFSIVCTCKFTEVLPSVVATTLHVLLSVDCLWKLRVLSPFGRLRKLVQLLSTGRPIEVEQVLPSIGWGRGNPWLPGHCRGIGHVVDLLSWCSGHLVGQVVVVTPSGRFFSKSIAPKQPGRKWEAALAPKIFTGSPPSSKDEESRLFIRVKYCLVDGYTVWAYMEHEDDMYQSLICECIWSACGNTLWVLVLCMCIHVSHLGLLVWICNWVMWWMFVLSCLFAWDCLFVCAWSLALSGESYVSTKAFLCVAYSTTLRFGGRRRTTCICRDYGRLRSPGGADAAPRPSLWDKMGQTSFLRRLCLFVGGDDGVGKLTKVFENTCA